MHMSQPKTSITFDKIRKRRTISLLALTLIVTGFSALLFHNSKISSFRNYMPTTTTFRGRQDILYFPQIYVANGILNCGGPLVPDKCSLCSPTSFSLSTTQQVLSIAPFNYSIEDQNFPLFQDYPTATIPLDTSLSFYVTYQITFAATPLFSRITATNSYFPSIAPTPLVTTSSPAAKAVRRSYDFNLCSGQPPSHNFVSGSLTDVCRFVANAQQWIVSLRPTSTSAYMPCWTGYFAQVLISVLNLVIIVSSFRRRCLMFRIKHFLEPKSVRSLPPWLAVSESYWALCGRFWLF